MALTHVRTAFSLRGFSQPPFGQGRSFLQQLGETNHHAQGPPYPLSSIASNGVLMLGLQPLRLRCTDTGAGWELSALLENGVCFLFQ